MGIDIDINIHKYKYRYRDRYRIVRQWKFVGSITEQSVVTQRKRKPIRLILRTRPSMTILDKKRFNENQFEPHIDQSRPTSNLDSLTP